MPDKVKRTEELEAEAKRLRDEAALDSIVPVRTPYLVEKKDGTFQVGVRDEPQVGEWPYNGPCADISADKDWLSIMTDEYHGHVKLNVAALPFLIEALQRLLAKRDS